ncbi:transcription factor FapR [Senegalia massiliensis]|uniref:Transcription factor FapR n=1 Tax=Senegalia massiliensis TaxID=1720316 RepID=A0A845QXY9_9CLOT|nr:transcription factor FapR [Senegalia massiliensis]NBI06864.1 transcription factor FapR [Senegalia massiliensis]
MKKRKPKKERQKELKEKLIEDPFWTDEELTEVFNVSIQTIRLDRLELGIPELRERVKNVAEKNHTKVRSIGGKEIVGELIDLELGNTGISILETTKDMAFEKTDIVRGHHIFAQAESIAMAVIDAEVALTGVANIKYNEPVKSGSKLIAKAEVVRQRANKYFVHVFIYESQKQVFRGKFILVSME